MAEAQVLPRQKVRYTYREYLKLPDDGRRYQIIKGELFMAPAPSP
ncbi:TPA: Uma2 family endonuclease, partial [Candidatus Poribacteria bacterium]|nr:Uma2 family endonuclease [Candidatus Poribacteria bacterium]